METQVVPTHGTNDQLKTFGTSEEDSTKYS